MCLELFLVLGLGYELGPSSDINHFGNGPTAQARIECVLPKNWSIEYNHHSSLLNGVPFGGKDDATTDVWTLNYKIRIK